MSTYNDNLRSNVLALLQTLEQDLTKVRSQKDASMLTLYYSQAEAINARKKIENIEDVQKKKLEVKTQAIKNSNISNNLLNSTNQTNLFAKQSITNSSVNASNVQIASHSIVKFASDLGSIFSIVNATDIGTDVHILSEEAKNLINNIAYDAETVSQKSMDVSKIILEIPASTVSDKSIANINLMNNVLKITSDEVTESDQKLFNEQSNLAKYCTLEKKSEGDYIDISIDYKSTKAAYLATIKELNFNLQVTNTTALDFTISFEKIKLPFKHLEDFLKANQKTIPYYPIKNYFLIIVKDIKKSNFTISNANKLLIDDEMNPKNNSNKQVKNKLSVPSPLNPRRLIIPITVPVDSTNISTLVLSSVNDLNQMINYSINYNEMMIDGKGPYTIQDSDGDDIDLGIKYVVYLLGIYTEDYKKQINCYDDFLSAPSPSFKFSNALVAVDGKTIKLPVTKFSTEELTSSTFNNSNILFENGVLNFKVVENPEIIAFVEYRCIFLKTNELKKYSVFNKESTLELMEEVESLEEITFNSNVNIQSHNKIKNNINIPYYFNLKIAEQVQPGNYIVARQSTSQSLQPLVGKSSNIKTKNDDLTIPSEKNRSGGLPFPEIEYTIQVNSDVTDNFGNPLIDGEKYIPVILSYYNKYDENFPKYSNSWSGYQNSNPIIFKRSSLKPNHTIQPVNHKILDKRIVEYGIKKRKKRGTDEMIINVLEAQQEVDQHQIIVTSLTLKLNDTLTLLSSAENEKEIASNNRNIINQLVNSTKELLENSNIAFKEIVLANKESKGLANSLKKLTEKLIYTVELINKLSELILRKKTINPLIPDELINFINRASVDANNTITLTLIALQSSNASQAANIKSEAAIALEYTQAKSLYKSITGIDHFNISPNAVWTNDSLAGLISEAYQHAKVIFEDKQRSYNLIKNQVELATIKLNKAQIKLKTLQSGLSACNTAKLIS